MDSLFPLPTDVGPYPRQDARRPDLVVLLVLAAEIPRHALRHQARAGRAAAHRRLPARRRRPRGRGGGVAAARGARPLIVVSRLADVGAVTGGWLSSRLMQRGASANRARKTAMLLMALVIVPTAFAPAAGSMWAAVLIVGVAAAAHQGWSANVYTLASDMFPKAAVGTAIGIGAFGGAMGGVLFQRLTGRILQANGNDYTPIFAVCGLAYVTAWVLIHLLAPRLEPVDVGGPPDIVEA